jgi:hypothetical protein
MNNPNYLDLTIHDIITLAAGDLDQSEAASRMSRFLGLSVKAQIHGCLGPQEQQQLINLADVLQIGGVR